MFKLILLFVLLCTIASCTTREGELSKLWFYSYSEGDSYDEEAPHSSQKTNALTPASFLNLQEGGAYTSNFYGFDWGIWKVEDDKILLQSSQKKNLQLGIRSVDKNELVIGDKETGAAYRFDGFSNNFKTESDNPFSKENNLWRVKAKQPETDAQLAARLRNHFKYWEKYFNWALKTDKKSLDVRSLPSSLKMYGNGFGVMKYDEQSPIWKGYFYDSTDSRRAYALTYEVVRDTRIVWPQTENIYKRFVSAFQQLQRGVK